MSDNNIIGHRIAPPLFPFPISLVSRALCLISLSLSRSLSRSIYLVRLRYNGRWSDLKPWFLAKDVRIRGLDLQHKRWLSGGDREGLPLRSSHRRWLQQLVPVRNPRRCQDAPHRHRIRSLLTERYELLSNLREILFNSGYVG